MDKELIETRDGLAVYLARDEDPQDPREDDNASHMVCFHPRYSLGDKHEFKSPDEFREWWKEHGKGGELMPLYLMDHSMIGMSTGDYGDMWDSGQVGWTYVTAEEIRREWATGNRITKKAREQARNYLRADVETYDDYLQGNVYGYIIEDASGKHLDSCWGFFGRKYAEEEGRAALRCEIDHAKKERRKQIKRDRERANEQLNETASSIEALR